MNLRSIDLNLLVIFDALMTERSISRAARKIGLSPSAASHALRRLRDTFEDELIARTPQGMMPTRRALDLHRRVRGALAEINRAVDQQLHFDPGSSERTFRLRIADYLVACLLPRVCVRARAEAPSATLIVECIGEDAGSREIPGDLQLCVNAGPRGPDYRRHPLLRSRLVVAMRSDHPAAGETMTLERFMSLPQLRVSGPTVGSKALDDMLAAQGMSRRIALSIPTLPALMPILEHSDLCSVQPEQWIALYGAQGRITTVPLPLRDIEFTVDMIWHKADDADAGHRWLRQLIAEEFGVLHSAVSGAAKRPEDSPDLLDRIPVGKARPE